MAGRLFAVVGPSGAGKDTLMAAAKARCDDLHLVRRVITRAKTAGGEDYEGVSQEAFDRRKAAGDFVLDWTAHGLCYGIPKSIEREIANGRVVLFNCSRGVLRQAWEVFSDLTVIHVTAAPSVLAARLAARGRESAADISARLARAAYELPQGPPVRVVDNSGSLDDAVVAFLATIQPVRR